MKYRRTHAPGNLVFLTLVTHRRRCFLTEEPARFALREAVRHVQRRHPFRIIAYVVMPDHCHMLWVLPEHDGDFSRRVRLIKHHMARQPGLVHPIWQARFWEHLIRDESDLHRHLDYIQHNPVKHGYVANVADWQDSSFAHLVQRGWYDAKWGSSPLDDKHEFGE